MLIRDGHLIVAAEAVISVAYRFRRGFVTGTRTGRRFLVEFSVLPSIKGALKTSGVILTAANGTRIQTHGP